jgi:transcription-repair coupling factor (superfamily II helicase)
MAVKIIAKAAGVSRIDGGARAVTITFSEGARISPDKIMALLKRNQGRIKLIPEFTLQIAIADETLKTASEALRKCLQQLR